MSLIVMIASIIGGLFLLFAGGESLVRGAVGLANRLGMPPVIIALTIVAYGTSAPELVVSIEAILDGFPDIAIGNVIGSNIANMLLVLGATAVISPIAVSSGLAKREGLFLMAVTLILSGAAYTGAISGIVGGVLLVMLAGFTFLLFKGATAVVGAGEASALAEEVAEMDADMSLSKAVIALIIGLAMLVGGSHLLIPAAVELARIAGISEALIGVTLIALGGSLPELATSLIAAWRKQADIAIGNVLGSNIFNIAGVVGAGSLIAPMEVSERFLRADVPVLLVVTALFLLALKMNASFGRALGCVALLGYAAYITAQFVWLG